MTTLCFGHVKEDISAEALTRLDGCSRLWKDDFPSRWGDIPDSFRGPLSKSVSLKTRGFVKGRNGVSFVAEWDEITSGVFRESEQWIGATNRADVRIRHVEGASWLFITVGPFDGFRVASRVSRALFDVQGRISTYDIPYSVLKEILRDDSRAEKYMWWKGVETGVDGGLRGSLPRTGGARERFDNAGKPTFARFECTSLNKLISISCKHGSIGGTHLTESEGTRYFLTQILPKVRAARASP